jgi:hypothetical protein
VCQEGHGCQKGQGVQEGLVLLNSSSCEVNSGILTKDLVMTYAMQYNAVQIILNNMKKKMIGHQQLSVKLGIQRKIIVKFSQGSKGMG